MWHRTRPLLRLIVVPFLLAAVLLPLAAPQRAQAQSVDDGLVGYWAFDEGAGSTSADGSGNGNTATLHTPNSFTGSTAPIDFANPFALAASNSASSYATAPGNNIDSLQQITVAFWARINAGAADTDADLVTLTNGKVLFGYYRASGSDNLFLTMSFTGVEVRLFDLGHVVTDGRYHHFAGSFDGQTLRFYIDGKLVNALDRPARGGPLSTSQGVMFSSPSTPLDGALDDVRIYNRSLSGSEVAALSYNCGSVQGIPAGECRALETLYRSTDGTNWTNHAGWLESNSPCTWAGVLCNNGHVIAINLPQNGLKGPLSADLGNLPELIVANLSNNRLTGTIPFELGNLGKLQTLDLYGNQLSGQVPFTLGNLAALTTLRLYNNQLRGPIPSQLANLTGLLTLDLGYNSLTAVDANLITFLNGKQPKWASTQTLPPANLKATVRTGTSVALTWDPIAYTGDGGYYQVLSTTQDSGVYAQIGRTSDKSATGFMVDGLTPGQPYSFLVRTFTPKHGLQQNDLLSDSTDPVTATPITTPVDDHDCPGRAAGQQDQLCLWRQPRRIHAGRHHAAGWRRLQREQDIHRAGRRLHGDRAADQRLPGCQHQLQAPRRYDCRPLQPPGRDRCGQRGQHHVHLCRAAGGADHRRQLQRPQP